MPRRKRNTNVLPEPLAAAPHSLRSNRANVPAERAPDHHDVAALPSRKRARPSGIVPSASDELLKWSKLRHNQLVAACKKHGLASTGTKDMLARRLVEKRVPIEPSAAPASNSSRSTDASALEHLIQSAETADEKALSSASASSTTVVNVEDEDVSRGADLVIRCIRDHVIPETLPRHIRDFIASAISQGLPAAPTTASPNTTPASSSIAQTFLSSPSRSAESESGAFSKPLEEKIKSGTYVDLSLFLSDTASAGTEEAYEVASSSNDERGLRFVLECKSSRGRSRRVDSLQTWMEAYLAYSGRVLHYRPALREDIMAYAACINRMCGQFGFVKTYLYDKSLRIKRAGFCSLWAPIDNELFLLAVTPSFQSADRSVGMAKRSNQRASAIKPCYKWNESKPCVYNPCRFAHVCRRCLSEAHRAAECPHAVRMDAGSGPNVRPVSKRTGPPKSTPTTTSA